MEIEIEERKTKLLDRLQKLEKDHNDLSLKSHFTNITFKPIQDDDFLYLLPTSSGSWKRLKADRKKTKLDEIEEALNRAEKEFNILNKLFGIIVPENQSVEELK